MAQIKSFVEPNRLYRYRPASELNREIAAIEGAYVYCASFDDMNDPMEGLFASSRRVRDSLGYQAFRQAVRNNKEALGICSFSEVHNHQLMWAHYAEQFSGICVSYSLRLLKQNLSNGVAFVRMFYNEGAPMIYRNETDPAGAAKKILSYKSYPWLYEREWRMFSRPGKTFYEDTKCVTRVYLGSRMKRTAREEVKGRLQQLKIPSSDMKIAKYALIFETN